MLSFFILAFDWKFSFVDNNRLREKKKNRLRVTFPPDFQFSFHRFQALGAF